MSKLHDHVCANDRCKVKFQSDRKDTLFHSRDCACEYNARMRTGTKAKKVIRGKCGVSTGGRKFSISGHTGSTPILRRGYSFFGS